MRDQFCTDSSKTLEFPKSWRKCRADSQGRFESIRHDLSKSLEEVEKKIAELTNRLEKGKDK
jgi:hypothetical protein